MLLLYHHKPIHLYFTLFHSPVPNSDRQGLTKETDSWPHPHIENIQPVLMNTEELYYTCSFQGLRV